MALSTVLQPKININVISANLPAENTAQRVLFVGQKTSAGTATSGALVTSIGNDHAEDGLFGVNSHIAGMIRSFRALNSRTRVDAISLSDDSGGTAATGTLAFSGTATAAGTLYITLGSYTNHRYEVPIASGDSAATIATAFEALVDADTKFPGVASLATATVTITSIHKGTVGNDITFLVEGSVAGITVTLTAMASGATNPSLTGLFDVIVDQRYQTIVYPGTYTKSTVTSFLDARFNATGRIMDGVAITTQFDSYANHITALSSLNSKSLVYIANKSVSATAHKGDSIVEFADVISSEFSAIRSLRLTADANISQYVVSTGGQRDSYGGPAIASLPYFNTPFYNLPLIFTGTGWTDDEIEDLLDAGGCVLGNNPSNDTLIAGEICTTYLTDAASNVDVTYKFLEYVDTISNVREYIYNNLRSDFSQHRLTEGDVLPGRAMANAIIIEAALDRYYRALSGDGYVLLQAGAAAIKYFKQNRSVTLDLSTGSATVTMITPIVTQLREIPATMQVSFSIN